ncbi:TFIIB-type zinc ribbon-containing protein, partial [Enterococcus mundtii]|nr:TFIIB-type zinc ribbon-containing protein [Enterococcus mundtii]
METTFTHKCPNCGGPLLFNPKDQKFHCEYCLNIYTEEEVTRYEQQQHEAHLENPSTTTAEENLTFTAEEEASATQQTETTENEAAAGTMEIFNCPSCGAQIVTDATTAATYC